MRRARRGGVYGESDGFEAVATGLGAHAAVREAARNARDRLQHRQAGAEVGISDRARLAERHRDARDALAAQELLARADEMDVGGVERRRLREQLGDELGADAAG